MAMGIHREKERRMLKERDRGMLVLQARTAQPSTSPGLIKLIVAKTRSITRMTGTSDRSDKAAGSRRRPFGPLHRPKEQS
jgi:hypothetical protein